MGERAGLVRALARVAVRPRLWAPAARLVPTRWWRRHPPSPIPPGDYVRFRTQTMYGDGGARVSAEDLIAYLEWCRRMRDSAR
jgi:hypothetical protein